MKNNIPFHFPSKTGVCEISAHIYTPEDGWFETVWQEYREKKLYGGGDDL